MVKIKKEHLRKIKDRRPEQDDTRLKLSLIKTTYHPPPTPLWGQSCDYFLLLLLYLIAGILLQQFLLHLQIMMKCTQDCCLGLKTLCIKFFF